jgi:hypothetical protein
MRNPPAKNDIRCQAEVAGVKGWNPPYDQDRQCARRSNQMRGLPSSVEVIRVCFQHASSRGIKKWEGPEGGI